MSEQSHFQALFEAAFRDYEKQTGEALANHPLVEKLQSCDSVESVTAVLREQTESSNEIRGKDKVFKPLKNILSVLHNLSSTPAVNLAQHLGLSFPPVTAIHTGLGILLSAVKGVLDDYDILADLLETVEHFLNRLDIYTRIPPTIGMTEMIIKILVELLSILALATKQLQQGKLKALVKKLLLGGKEIEAVLQRLDRLTGDEARMTAAQTLQVVHGLFQNMKDVVDDGKSSIKHVQDALEIIQQLASDMNKSKRDTLEQNIQRWLSPPDPWKNQNIACKSRHRGSAEWFLQGSTYSDWKASEASGAILWVHGKPGAGKSVLCSTIIEDIDTMRKAGLASLAFFYYDFREDQKKNIHGLLSSLLVQFCHQSDLYCDILSKLYSEHANGSRNPSDDVLAGCLKELLKLPGHAPVYLIMDALDECPNTSSIPSPRDEVLNLIEGLMKSEIPHLRICVTSRPETDIKKFLESLVLHTVSLHDESGQKGDIEEFIKSVINTNPKNYRWKAADKQLVIKVLIEKADGMFRWVYCQVVYICGLIPACIRHALAELPDTLDETYERTLREINKAEWEIAHRLFQLIAVAVRPLRVEELAELLAFDFETGAIPKFHEDWRLEDPIQAVLSICPSFLTILDYKTPYIHQRLVQFSHFSVKEFLTSGRLGKADDTILRRYHISETSAHTLAARVCLAYFLHVDKDVTTGRLPLFDYAEHWVLHARFEDVSRNIKDGLKELFDPSKPHFAFCIWICDPTLASSDRRGRSEIPSSFHGTTPVHYAAIWDFDSIIEMLVNEHSQNVNSQDYTISATPLHVASGDGKMKTARRLLEYGADVKAQNLYKDTPLHVALKRGQLETARMLIEHGASASARDTDGQTPLHLVFAVYNARFGVSGYVEFARMLIERGADVSAQNKDGQTPLHVASGWGQLEVACTLIDRGADVSAQSKNGETPLHAASAAGQLEVACTLIDRGADVSAQNKYGQTPLHLASKWGQLEVGCTLIDRNADVFVQTKDLPFFPTSRWGQLEVACTLIDRGADASAQNKDGQTPLHLVSGSGQLEIARMLIKCGASVSAQNKDGQTPLHLASLGIRDIYLKTSGHLEVARMLVECGAEVSAKNKDSQTPLHLALQMGQVGVAFMLIEHGADVSTRNKDSQTLLHMASAAGQLGVACTLIDRGADASAQNKDGQTPLHLVSGSGQLEIARMLIERGADVSAQNKYGQTPLHLVSLVIWNPFLPTSSHPEVASMLIELGADVSAQDKGNQTPLHLAMQTGQLEIARILIERGANVSTQDKDGQTPLHLMSLGNWNPFPDISYVDIARMLIERGADVSAKNKDGQTPLHLLFLGNWDPIFGTSCHGEIAHMFIERGADISSQNNDGETPLHLASRSGRVGVARMLIERGASVSIQNKDGLTSLHMVSLTNWNLFPSTCNHLEVARLLIEHGADMKAQSKNKNSPLHVALKRGQLDIARMLIERGAGVSAPNNDGQTPLHLVSLGNRTTISGFFDHPKVAHMLIERGADVSARDKDGRTPRDLASQAEQLEITQMLGTEAPPASPEEELEITQILGTDASLVSRPSRYFMAFGLVILVLSYFLKSDLLWSVLPL